MDSAFIILVDDDEDDCKLVSEAFPSSQMKSEVKCLSSGEELLDYLYRKNAYADSALPAPDLILLDLNMPGMNGLEVLKKIKTDPGLKSVPVIVLTTSCTEIDILMSYQFGANSFMKKPATFDAMIEAVGILMQFWFGVARVPSGKCLKNEG